MRFRGPVGPKGQRRRTWLVTQTKTDVKTVQAMLRHADSGTTLDLYTHAINRDKLVAQNQVMEAMMKSELVN
jgi:integrase